MMLAADLTTYYNRVRRHLDCPKDEQNRLLLGQYRTEKMQNKGKCGKI